MKYDIDDTLQIINNVYNALALTKDIAKMPNCGNCIKKDCEHRPSPGETTRFNCFLWEGMMPSEKGNNDR